MGGYIIVAGGETLPEGFQGVQASRAELIDCAKCAVIVCDGAEVPRVVRAAGVMINGDSAAVPSERVSGVQLITCGRGVKNTVSVTYDDGEALTLALNRAVETLSGVCEPMELPVRRRGRSDFMCMAEFAAAILLDEIGQ